MSTPRNTAVAKRSRKVCIVMLHEARSGRAFGIDEQREGGIDRQNCEAFPMTEVLASKPFTLRFSASRCSAAMIGSPHHATSVSNASRWPGLPR